jgi:UDP-N-acetylmuramoyl-tripeptide--D-alanyl-D-alanine ligase
VIALQLSELAGITEGRLVLPSASAASEADVVAGSVQTDSRLVETGSIFFALPGEETDGALFAGDAVANGAALVVAERMLDLSVPLLIVSDGVEALGRLASAVVARVRDAGRLKVVGITGSNGKTTTKNLLGAIFSAEGPTVAPRESFNNQVGAPVSMLRVEADTRYLVVEMGASGIGDIARLVRIVRPDVSIVLKVGLAHAGEFGGIEATQRAKSEIVTELTPSDVAILNADDTRVAAMAELTAAKVRWFGLGPAADVRAENVHAGAEGTSFTVIVGTRDGAVERADVRLKILGEHHVMNALAALSAATTLGVPLDRAVRAIEAVARAERWRMEVLQPGGGITVINDAYNASPDSMAAALKTLAQIRRPGERTIAVLGEMAELGEFAREEHDRIGRLAVRLNVDLLVVVGEAARPIHLGAGLEGSWNGESVQVASIDAAYDVLREELRAGDVVLVKSSKSAGLRFLGDRIGGVLT